MRHAAQTPALVVVISSRSLTASYPAQTIVATPLTRRKFRCPILAKTHNISSGEAIPPALFTAPRECEECHHGSG